MKNLKKSANKFKIIKIQYNEEKEIIDSNIDYFTHFYCEISSGT